MQIVALIVLAVIIGGLATILYMSQPTRARGIAVTFIGFALLGAVVSCKIYVERNHPVTGGEENPYCDGDECPPSHPWEQ